MNLCDSRFLGGTELAPSVRAGSSLECRRNGEDRSCSGWWWQVQHIWCSRWCQYFSAPGKIQPDANCINCEALRWEAFLWSAYVVEWKEKNYCDMLGCMLLIARHNNSFLQQDLSFPLPPHPMKWSCQYGESNLEEPVMKKCCCHGIEFWSYIERIS